MRGTSKNRQLQAQLAVFPPREHFSRPVMTSESTSSPFGEFWGIITCSLRENEIQSREL
jgi:hypothetical protein